MTAEVHPRPFLRQVADHYLDKGLDGRIFVFPNKRSIAFFKKYIADALKERGASPVIAPRMMGISEFFTAMTGRKNADHITLILKLYESYSRIVPGGESLDDFLYWGDTLLSDFGDIDKYQIDAKSIFSNILDLKLMEGDLSFLTDEQKDAIRRLSGYFIPEKWAHDPNNAKDVKARFLNVWSHMYELYADYRESLTSEGLAYDGMVYRELADFVETGSASTLLNTIFPGATCCVFIGLNTLNTCENDVLAALQKEHLAEFCWDFSGSILTDELNQASHFMKNNISRFPNPDFKLDPDGLPNPEVHIVGVPSASAQAKVVHEIISNVDEKERGLDFAVVLPDESMLSPVLSSLPQLDIVNVTMGYPLATSEWNALMRSIIALQFHSKDAKWFYHVQVREIFTNAIVKGVFCEEENTCAADVQKGAKAYIPLSDLSKSDLFSLIFKPVVADMTLASAEQVKALASYLCEVVEAVAGRLDAERDALHLECAYRYLQCVKRLAGMELPVLPKTFVRLLEQLVARINVPFSGEPLGGLQIMGPLETRCLDFKHLVILNANEGVFPGRNISSSIIPPELRLAFGLPTYELQDNIWAYYFYRMISRAQDVWMLYDSRTEGIATGEESRYIKQLRYMYHDRCNIKKDSAMLRISAVQQEQTIEKTEEDIEKIRQHVFSASSIHRYLNCPVSFYYYVVKRLFAEDEVKEDLDSGMLGEVCHDTLQAIYCCEEAMSPTYFFNKLNDDEISRRTVGTVGEDFIKGWLKRKDDIRKKVEALVCHEVKCPVVEGKDLVSVEIALRYITRVLEADLELIRKHGRLTILGLEKKYYGTIQGHNFKGFVDRIDTFEDGSVRIVDYKTGKDHQDVLDPSKKTSEITRGIFDGGDKDSWKAAFQFFVYDVLVKEKGGFGNVQFKNSMYPLADIFTKEVGVYRCDDSVMKAIDGKLEELFAKMEDKSIPFEMNPGPNSKHCKYCDYAVLCGKAVKK